VLFQLEPQDYRVFVDKAAAALERNQAEIQMTEFSISATEAQTSAHVTGAEALVAASQQKENESRHHLEELKRAFDVTQAEFENSNRDLTRYENLFRAGAGTEQKLDNTSTSFKKAKAHREAAQSQIAAAQDTLSLFLHLQQWSKSNLAAAKADIFKLDIEKKKLESLKAKHREMQAELEAAELNLSYCVIKAPISGYISQHDIDIGERVQSGQPLLSVVPLQDVWVEANFKETQLKDVRIGQSVEIKVDMYPSQVFMGKVYGIDAGTGAAFSLLPAQNATGNWIKVVQRVPVKVLLDSPPPAEYPLRIGCSLEVTISTSDKSGPKLRTAKMSENPDVKLSQQSKE
jgi:membrane fusion protein (multidrug efflux system)